MGKNYFQEMIHRLGAQTQGDFRAQDSDLNSDEISLLRQEIAVGIGE
jgi:hypothetical protein